MISIRSAREDDVPHLTAIGLAAWEKAVSGLVDATDMRRVAELSFLSFLRSSWFAVIVIEADDVRLGWAAREDNDGNISDLWVDPTAQRSGVGSMLLENMEADILAAGFDAAIIKTHARNAQAIGFFEKHGYAVSSLSTAYAPKLDKDIESVGMTKVLREPAGRMSQHWF